MTTTREDVLGMDPDEAFDLDSEALYAGLEALDIMIGKNWSKSKKAYELNTAIKKMKPVNNAEMSFQSPDNGNITMLQTLQLMQQQMAQQSQAMVEDRERAAFFEKEHTYPK